MHAATRMPRLFGLDNMIQNKRGISDVVATVLIMMITIAAVAVIAGFVVPFVRNSLQKSTECAAYKSYYTFDESFGYNCYDENIYSISIKASFDKLLAENVGGIKIVFSDKSGASKVVEIKNDSISSQDEGGISIKGSPFENLRIPGPGGVITYAYSALAEEQFLSAEVYPVLKNGRICADSKESIDLIACRD